MSFVPMLDLLKGAVSGGYAVPSFCVWNAETMLTVLRVADAMRAPVILMGGPCELDLMGPAEMGAVARIIARQFSLPIALHLDHGDSLELVERCLDAGYSSVMLDYSSRPFAENVAALRQVVQLAHPRGATVEGEIGHVGTADTITVEGNGDSTLTTVAEASAYVEQTGVDALAVSIGNAHGQYTKLPRLDFARLAEIHAAVKIPLVLHGGSGTPEADLKKAISLGMAKINVATDLVTAQRQSLLGDWQGGENLWIPMAQTRAMQAMVPAIERWIHATGAAGKA